MFYQDEVLSNTQSGNTILNLDSKFVSLVGQVVLVVTLALTVANRNTLNTLLDLSRNI